MNSNPWQVNSIDAFYYLKCPECMFFSKKEIDFKDHAIKNHLMSNILFENLAQHEQKSNIDQDNIDVPLTSTQSNSLIDPLKEECCESKSKDNEYLVLTIIKSLDGIKVEENNETVFAENLDLKEEEYSRESNDQNNSYYDPLISMNITADEAYQYYKNNLRKKGGVKGGTFGNVKKILEWKKVEIKPRPCDPALRKKYQSEKDGLVRNFDRIIQRVNRKKKGQKSSITIFFDSSKYQTLTMVI